MLNHKVRDLYQPMQSYSFARRIGSTDGNGKPDYSVYSLDVQGGNVNPSANSRKFLIAADLPDVSGCIVMSWRYLMRYQPFPELKMCMDGISGDLSVLFVQIMI